MSCTKDVDVPKKFADELWKYIPIECKLFGHQQQCPMRAEICLILNSENSEWWYQFNWIHKKDNEFVFMEIVIEVWIIEMDRSASLIESFAVGVQKVYM